MQVGVVIRALAEAELIGRCLEALRGQRGSHALDLVVVDSGSTDATVEIAEAGGARVVHIAPEDFDYSTALNLGIEEARGELVAVLSAHAIPLDDRWLERMLAPFEDPKVAGVGSRQVAWPGAGWSEVERLRAAFGGTRREYRGGDTGGLLFSNAASVIRRSVWEEHRFTLPAVEDLEWARRVIAAGLINRALTPAGGRTRRRTLREAAALLYREGRVIGGSTSPSAASSPTSASCCRRSGTT